VSWLNLASWIPCTEVEGPGRRAALWVQGCDKRCIGCCNPGYLKIMERDILSAETMIERLLAAHEEVWRGSRLVANHFFRRRDLL
jgi:anaerobic ribonucleoside-triphosphate reductase activating protein